MELTHGREALPAAGGWIQLKETSGGALTARRRKLRLGNIHGCGSHNCGAVDGIGWIAVHNRRQDQISSATTASGCGLPRNGRVEIYYARRGRLPQYRAGDVPRYWGMYVVAESPILHRNNACNRHALGRNVNGHKLLVMAAAQQGQQKNADHDDRKTAEHKNSHRTNPSASRQEF